MWDKDNDIEHIFNSEVREKKRTASGIHHKTGKRGYIGVMRTPADVLRHNNRKAYKEYTKASVIVVSSVFQDINNLPSIQEIKAKDFKSAQLIVREAKKNHTIKKLAKHWRISGYGLYKLLDTYEVEYEKRGARPPKTTDSTPQADLLEKQRLIAQEAKAMQEESKKVIVPPTPIIVSLPNPIEENEGFQLKYTEKEVLGEEIQDRIMNYMGILLKDRQYEIKLTIRELPKKV